MNPDTLLTLAEVSAAFIGFSAITTVLANRGAMHNEDRAKFIFIISIGGLTVVDCFIPFWVLESTGEMATLWQLSTIFELLIGIPLILWMGVLVSQIKLNLDSRTKTARYAFATIALTAYGLICSSQIWSWPFESSQRVYEMGLILNLLIVALSFAMLVLNDPAAKVED